MAPSTSTESLLSAAEKSRQSLESMGALISEIERLVSTSEVDTDAIMKAQRQVLLDSFIVKKFHREHKEWEHSRKAEFVQHEVLPYNQKYAEMSRLYEDFERLQAALEELRKNTLIPAFDFSIQTIEQFENGALLSRLERDASGRYPVKVLVKQLFSLDNNSNLPPPSFPVFNRLVNLEFRLRVLLQIKHEVLSRTKARLAAKNTQWASRDAKLNLFLTRDFGAVYEEIAKIKTSEHEDLKLYEDDLEEEQEEDDDDEKDDDEEEDDDDDDHEKDIEMGDEERIESDNSRADQDGVLPTRENGEANEAECLGPKKSQSPLFEPETGGSNDATTSAESAAADIEMTDPAEENNSRAGLDGVTLESTSTSAAPDAAEGGTPQEDMVLD